MHSQCERQKKDPRCCPSRVFFSVRLEALRGQHELLLVLRLEARVARVLVDDQPRLGPRARELPRRHGRAHAVVPPLHDDARDVADAAHVLDQLLVAREEAPVAEVVALDARERVGEFVAPVLGPA